MEDMMYSVLCEIRDELSDIKYELQQIRGVGNFSKDLYDVCEKLEDIETAVRNLD